MAVAGVVDRVAVVVGNQVITESELLREVRLTEFMNGEPLDLSPEKRRIAAERLVDQQLVRKEMEIGSYPPPSPQEADAMLRKFRQEHYPGLRWATRPPCQIGKGFTDRRLYQVVAQRSDVCLGRYRGVTKRQYE